MNRIFKVEAESSDVMKRGLGVPVRKPVGGELGIAAPIRRAAGGAELGELLNIMKSQANTDSDR